MTIKLSEIKISVKEALIKASTSFRSDQQKAYETAIAKETEKNARWVLEMILENAIIAERSRLPLCDDTGVPYVLTEIGESAEIEGNIGGVFRAINQGIAEGLGALPGRPMAVKGNSLERIAQTKGLYKDSGSLAPSPLRLKSIEGKQIRITVIMIGGGSEIRARTYRVFHHHDASIVNREIVSWAVEMVGLLGCTPCIPAIGIGRSHYEATCLMMDAMSYKSFANESDFESTITKAINETAVGALSLGGDITALNTFVEIGPQRASGVRIVCLRLGCCFDPRRSTVILE